MRFVATIILALMFCSAAEACEPSIIGTWRSDGPKTMSFIRQNVKLEQRQDAFLAALMGHMTLEFDAKELHLRMPDLQVSVNGESRPSAGFEERKPYKVLLCNERVVVISTPHTRTGKDDPTTYYFTGPDTMWAYSGSNDPAIPDMHLREYFTRVR